MEVFLELECGDGRRLEEFGDTLPWMPLLRGDVARVGGGEPPSVCQPEVCNTLWSLERVGRLSEQSGCRDPRSNGKSGLGLERVQGWPP